MNIQGNKVGQKENKKSLQKELKDVQICDLNN